MTTKITTNNTTTKDKIKIGMWGTFTIVPTMIILVATLLDFTNAQSINDNTTRILTQIEDNSYLWNKVEERREEIKGYHEEYNTIVEYQEELHQSSNELRNQLSKEKSDSYNIFFTSYNPEAGQTDSTPCIAGGTGANVCEIYANGERPIALSQELISWSILKGEIKPYTKVLLESDIEQCNGEFVVVDAMNIRYRERGDIFFPNRSLNTSCHATMTILK